MSHVRMTDGRITAGGRRRTGRKDGSRRGLSTVEMALVLLLLLWIVFGIVEYGWMLLKYQEITGATRQGARVGAPFHRNNGHIQAAVQNSLTNVGFDANNYMMCIGTPDSQCSGSSHTVSVENLSPGDLFEVVVTLRYNQDNGVTLGFPLIPKPAELRTRLTMVREGI